MSTLVFFHAHPDDEAIATGGTMARAAEAGHRVVLVVATNGDEGEVAEGDAILTLGAGDIYRLAEALTSTEAQG